MLGLAKNGRNASKIPAASDSSCEPPTTSQRLKHFNPEEVQLGPAYYGKQRGSRLGSAWMPNVSTHRRLLRGSSLTGLPSAKWSESPP
eukprot:scaffold141630_cov46-Prasinocladus_malaysianus.AAC.1